MELIRITRRPSVKITKGSHSFILNEHLAKYRSSHWRYSVKKVSEISQNSQENTCVRVSSLIKLQTSGLRPATSLKKDSGTGVFL